MSAVVAQDVLFGDCCINIIEDLGRARGGSIDGCEYAIVNHNGKLIVMVNGGGLGEFDRGARRNYRWRGLRGGVGRRGKGGEGFTRGGWVVNGGLCSLREVGVGGGVKGGGRVRRPFRVYGWGGGETGEREGVEART